MKAIKIEKEDIKELVTIDMVLELYGIPLTKGKYKRCCCPFHEEKTPSFDVTKDGKIFYCFGCRETGDVLDLAKKLSGITYLPDLLLFLNNAFNLGLTSEKTSKKIQEKIKKREKEQKERAKKTAERIKKSEEIMSEIKKLDEQLIAIDIRIKQEQEQAYNHGNVDVFMEILFKLLEKKGKIEQRLYFLEVEQEKILKKY